MKEKESEIQKAILEFLHYQPGVFAFRTNNIGVPLHGKHEGRFRPSQTPGLADIIACVYGYFVAFEVKRPGGKLTKQQEDFAWKVKMKGGGRAHVVTSVDEVEMVLKGLKVK